MIVKCTKRPDGWIPVKGNELKICEHLLKHNYYEECSVEKDGNDFDCYLSSNCFGESYFDNKDGYFVKLNNDGSINASQKQPSFEDYVAMEFNLTGDYDWVKWLFKAPNIHSLHQNQITNTIKEWYTKPTPFQMQQGSILVFDKNSKYLHNVLNRTSVTIDDVLLENGYAVQGTSINQEIYTLEKRLLKSRNLEEKRCIRNRIRFLKNREG